MLSTPELSSPDRRPARWADLRARFLSAVVLAPLALGAIWLGGALFAALVTLLTIGLAREWLALCQQPAKSWTGAIFAALPAAVVMMALGQPIIALSLLAAATATEVIAVRGFWPSRPLPFGIPYLGLAALALIWLRGPGPGSASGDVGGVNVIVLLLIVWASDIGAYGVGRAVGGPRLAPTISPGKTWSGAVGGLLAAAATGLAAAAFLAGGPISWRPACIAVWISLIGQGGDLFESQLKRHFGVKDSGNVIPGHGGLLDRLDAVLTAAPAAALLALVLGPGVILWE